MTNLAYFLVLLLTGVRTEEVATPASRLGPRNFNHHAYDARQYLQELEPEPTKKGPVLFPNDGPPPPRPPLVVTSRPLSESIARSELNPSPPDTNNSIPASSQINRVSFKPDYLAGVKPFLATLKPQFLAKVKEYKPFAYPAVTTGGPYADYGPPYPDVVQKHRFTSAGKDDRYTDYEEHSVLPPIYKALSDHANQKYLKIQQKPQHYDYQVKEPEYSHRYQNNDGRGVDGDTEYDHGQNYAFSYTVKDHKTGDDFSHSQHSSGSATNGEYRVRLPDGRMQIVSYTADDNGYRADVRYDEDKTAGNSIDNRNDYKNNNHNDYKPNNHNDYKPNNHNDYKPNNHNDYKLNNHIQNSHKNYNQNNNIDHTQKTHTDYNQNIHNNYENNRPDFNDRHNDYNDNIHDYVQNTEYKPVDVNENYKAPAKEDYNQYSDLSKEYYNNDYSLEYDGKHDNYDPHRSKFTSFIENETPKPNLGVIFVPRQPKNKNTASASTVKPSYDELKDLFVTKNLYSVQPTEDYYKNPIDNNVPSTTPNFNNFEQTTEHVVVIGTSKPNLYTNIRNIPLTATPSPLSFTTPSSFVTPKSYLVSTISSLKNRINAKPVLSNSFIERINKYLSFN